MFREYKLLITILVIFTIFSITVQSINFYHKKEYKRLFLEASRDLEFNRIAYAEEINYLNEEIKKLKEELNECNNKPSFPGIFGR